MIVLLTLLWMSLLIFFSIYGTIKHWNYKMVFKIWLPISILFLVALLIMLRLPWWLIVILTVAAIIASIGYVKGTIELGQFIRERFFKK